MQTASANCRRDYRGDVPLRGVVVPAGRGGDAVEPVEPVAAPVVPPLMSAPGAAVDESGTERARWRRGRPVVPVLVDVPLREPLIEPPDIELPDIEWLELPAPIVPPLIPLPEPELIVLLPAALMLFVTPPLVSLALTLSCRIPRMRRPERTDEVRVVDATLAVSPFEFATVVWLARVTCRCVTVRGRRGTSELSCTEDDICVDGWAVDEPAVDEPAVDEPAVDEAGGCEFDARRLDDGTDG